MTYPHTPPPTQQPYYRPPMPPRRSNGLATAGFVVALCGAVLSIIPFLGIVAWVVAPVGIVLSVVGLLRAGELGGRGMAITGLVLGAVGLLICTIWAIGFAAATTPGSTYSAPPRSYSAPSSVAPGYTAPSQAADAPAVAAPLVLEVTGDFSRASVTHSNETGGVATSQERLPFRLEVPDPGGFNVITLGASRDFTAGMSGSGSISCRVTQNGRVLSTQTAAGDYPTVFCSG